MAAAGGAASILTQVQQGGPAPMNTLGGKCMAMPAANEVRLMGCLQMSEPMRILLWTFGMAYRSM